jgi:hypothetical protein
VVGVQLSELRAGRGGQVHPILVSVHEGDAQWPDEAAVARADGVPEHALRCGQGA